MARDEKVTPAVYVRYFCTPLVTLFEDDFLPYIRRFLLFFVQQTCLHEMEG
jgi:hypothetical protein